MRCPTHSPPRWSNGRAADVREKPEAWLLTVARRKLIDGARRRITSELVRRRCARLRRLASRIADEPEIPDQRLALMFACTHPSIDVAIRAPLMLQTVLGLDAARIASAFLVSPATMGKRLVRAKEKIRSAGIPMQIPTRDELPARLADVLDAIYAAYAEGWNDHAAPTPRADSSPTKRCSSATSSSISPSTNPKRSACSR